MESIAVVFLISAGVVAIASVLFVAWIFVMMAKLIIRGLAALFVAPAPSRPRLRVCAHRDCTANNVAHARFCRRCGRSMDGRVGSGSVMTA